MVKKIAITGGSGFLGQALTALLLKQTTPYAIINIDRQNGYDVMDMASLEAQLPQVDTIIHLAAKTSVPESYQSPRGFYEINTLGTANVLEICRKQQCSLIYLSSYVYGHPASLPIKETDALSAANPYGQSKLMGELLCEAYARDFGVNATSLRLFNLYGPGQGTNFLIGKIIDQAHKGIPIQLQDPRPKRDYVYMDDVLDAIVKVVAHPALTGFNAYNIANGISYSIEELLNIVKKHYPSLTYSFTNEQRPNEILDTVADISKARQELDWAPKYSLEQGIAKIIASK